MVSHCVKQRKMGMFRSKTVSHCVRFCYLGCYLVDFVFFFF